MSTFVNGPEIDLWNQVRRLPSEDRLNLATRILQSLEEESERRCQPRRSLADLVGLMSSGNPPPTDADVDRILDEERSRKFL